MKEKLLMVGIGGAGSNVASEFEKRGYLVQYINTSKADMPNPKSKFKYHIPGSGGCAKNQNTALEYAKDYYEHIVNLIDNQFDSEYVFFIFSLGGGTGSGISPIILDILSRKNPHKTYGVIAIMPSIKESPQSLQNALTTYKRITQLDNVGNVYLIDNNTVEDKFQINKKFPDLFDKFMNITNADSRGVIDTEEIATLLKVKGNAVIEEFHSLNYTTNPKFEKSIFTPYRATCKYLAYSTTDVVNPFMFTNKFGASIDNFVGYNDEDNMVIATGLTYPNERLQEYLTMCKSRQHELNRVNREFDYDIPDFKQENKVISITERIEPEEKKDNYDDIFAKYMS